MLSLFRLALVKIVLENPCTNPMRTSSYSLLKEGKTPEPLELLSQVPTLNYNPKLSVYDGLMGHPSTSQETVRVQGRAGIGFEGGGDANA
jgi:hypothetical protein